MSFRSYIGIGTVLGLAALGCGEDAAAQQEKGKG